MFTDDSKGLAIFRAHRADKKEIAILAKEVALSNPDKTTQECRILAIEIRAARQRGAQRNAQQGKGKRRSNREPTSSQRNMVVTTVQGEKR